MTAFLYVYEKSRILPVSLFLDKNNARSLEKNRQSVMRLRKRCEQFDNRFGRIDRLLRRYTGGHTQIYCLS